MISKYEDICRAIWRMSKMYGMDHRNIMRRWIHIFEDTEVDDWNRDEFMECMIKCKKEVEK